MAEARPAAAGIVITEEAEPRVLMVRRSKALRFMAGHHAFPGGRIEPDEGTGNVEAARNESTARALKALVREIFEETGLLIKRIHELPVSEEAKNTDARAYYFTREFPQWWAFELIKRGGV